MEEREDILKSRRSDISNNVFTIARIENRLDGNNSHLRGGHKG